jgi:DNA mismatch endonuclease (patch repair protein)
MADVLTREQRRLNMSRIRGRDTTPELIVRRAVHRMGLRFRLHRRDLPGTPDLVLPRHRKIIEVRGCYWHMHDCPYGRVKPKTRAEFWEQKRQQTVQRDRLNLESLRQLGWQVLVVWECGTRDRDRLNKCLAEFLAG